MTDPTIVLDEDGAVELPVVEILTGRSFITGISGAGKSNTASVVIEELLDQGYPVLIVDVDGEYWGLKEEFEILHVGADEECDLRVGPEHAGKLAELALEENIPIILDVSGYIDEDERSELIRETARELFVREKTLKKPFLMLVEEVHEWIPEGGGLAETGEMLVRVAKRGRKRGLGIAGLSQRPADVKKDFITQCDWLVWHRLTWANDTKVVRDVLGKEYQDTIADLDDGEAFLWTPGSIIDADIQRVQVRRKRTFDAGDRPGLSDLERPELKSVGEDLVDELQEISDREERRQDRISQLENRLDEKDDRIEELQEELERAKDIADVADTFSERLSATIGGLSGDIDVDNIRAEALEIREEKRELEDELETVRDERDHLRDRVSELETDVEAAQQNEALEAFRDEFVELVDRHEGVLDAEVAGVDEKLRERCKQLQEELDDARAEIEQLRQNGAGEFEEVVDLLAEDAAQETIELLGERSDYADEHTRNVIDALVGADPVTAGEVAPYVSLGDSSVGDVLRELHRAGVVERLEDGRTVRYQLDKNGIENRVRVSRAQQRVAEQRNGGDS